MSSWKLHLLFKVGRKTEDDSGKVVQKRQAIYNAGQLGTLYDLYRDQMLNTIDVKKSHVTTEKSKRGECQLHVGKIDSNENLLELIGIDIDLRLSILLNLVSSTRLTSITDYLHPVNEYTRFLYYTYKHKTTTLSNAVEFKRVTTQSKATHIITEVSWGVQCIVILQLPKDENTSKGIDDLLETVRSNMASDKPHSFLLPLEDQALLKQIESTRIYSNISELSTMTTIADVYSNIRRFIENKAYRQPIEFILSPSEDVRILDNSVLNSNYEVQKKEFEQHLAQQSSSINCLRAFFSGIDTSGWLDEELREAFAKLMIRWLGIKKRYDDEIRRLADLVVNFRQGKIEKPQLQQITNEKCHKALVKDIEQLKEMVKNCAEKEPFVKELKEKQFHYRSIVNEKINSMDDVRKVAEKLIGDGFSRILCSTDVLNETDQDQFNQLCAQLVEEHARNPDIHLFYADFSYCLFPLPAMFVFPEEKPRDTFVNILLLGETGVGKSTFVNALVNYLTFETLGDAESKKLVVVIPVSFIITTGDDFQEHTLKFGHFGKDKNENFDHPGQSVTQHCRSYVFNLEKFEGKKLRIIDTPGFGDTRGADQDEINMRHIIEYISNLTHLNGICVLLKPGGSRLNSFFRLCFTQLFDLLGPNTAQNVIFCFTNARSTFYTPGDTGPILRKMLQSFPPYNNIPFKKENTFCFDNESFRYLLVLQSSLKFDELDRNEYEKSWSISVEQAKHFLCYISSTLSKHQVNTQQRSIRHAQMEIMTMIRPILEALRNTLRNLILKNIGSTNKSIRLCPTPIQHPISFCRTCQLPSELLNNFRIVSERAPSCQCDRNKRLPIDYILSYAVSDTPNPLNEKDQCSLLFNAIIELACFLRTTMHSSKNDPFLMDFRRMLKEEQQFCTRPDENSFNAHLLEELKRLNDKYKQKMKTDSNEVSLAVLYERIQTTQNYPVVKEQVDAIKKGRENTMKYYERTIPDNSTDSSDATVISV